MKTAEIKEAIRDRIAEQIRPADIEEAILTAVFEFDFRETISYALEDAIGSYISDFVDDLARDVVGEVVNDKLDEYFN